MRCEQSSVAERSEYASSRGASGVLARRAMAGLERGFAQRWNELSAARALPPALQSVSDAVLVDGDYWRLQGK